MTSDERRDASSYGTHLRRDGFHCRRARRKLECGRQAAASGQQTKVKWMARARFIWRKLLDSFFHYAITGANVGRQSVRETGFRVRSRGDSKQAGAEPTTTPSGRRLNSTLGRETCGRPELARHARSMGLRVGGRMRARPCDLWDGSMRMPAASESNGGQPDMTDHRIGCTWTMAMN